MKDTNRLIIGLILIVLGIGFLCDQLGLFTTWGIDFGNVIGTFWPVILMIIGVSLLTKNSINSGLFFLFLGVVFQISQLFDYDVWGLLWPFIIIWIGVSVLLRKPSAPWSSSSGISQGDSVDAFAIFWGVEKRIVSKNFKGGSATCFFGGVKLDLREAVIAKEGAAIEVTTGFGGVEIWLPKNCAVESDGTPIFGGWENKYALRKETGVPVLKIKGTVFFGGVDVKD